MGLAIRLADLRICAVEVCLVTTMGRPVNVLTRPANLQRDFACGFSLFSPAVSTVLEIPANAVIWAESRGVIFAKRRAEMLPGNRRIKELS